MKTADSEPKGAADANRTIKQLETKKTAPTKAASSLSMMGCCRTFPEKPFLM